MRILQKRSAIGLFLGTGLLLGLLLLCPAARTEALAEEASAGPELVAGLTLDWSGASRGVLPCSCAEGAGPFQIRIAKDGNAYRYNISPGEELRLPLQMGEGNYTVEVFSPAGGGSWERLLKEEIPVNFETSQAPFLTGNLYVPLAGEGTVAALAAELTENCRGDARKVGILYRYVAENIAYDGEKAELLDGSYRPDPARTLAEQRGICLDYAALLCALCREAGIPAKLVTGHLTDSGIYHAWNEVYYLGRWHRLDPTLGPAAGTGRNYTAERVY